jgi:hypothetical protein
MAPEPCTSAWYETLGPAASRSFAISEAGVAFPGGEGRVHAGEGEGLRELDQPVKVGGAEVLFAGPGGRRVPDDVASGGHAPLAGDDIVVALREAARALKLGPQPLILGEEPGDDLVLIRHPGKLLLAGTDSTDLLIILSDVASAAPFLPEKRSDALGQGPFLLERRPRSTECGVS